MVNEKQGKEEKLTLELLNAIDRQSDLNQRHMARYMGVALGLANSYMKRCVRKGFVKINEAPANRYLYYLTPKGFTEKARLTAKYLSSSLVFYRQAAESCTSVFNACTRRGWNRIVLCGLSDLAEIALLRAVEANVEIVGIYDPASNRQCYFSKPVWQEFNEIDGYDACLVTDLTTPLAIYEELARQLGEERVWVPRVLGLSNHSTNTSGGNKRFGTP